MPESVFAYEVRAIWVDTEPRMMGNGRKARPVLTGLCAQLPADKSVSRKHMPRLPANKAAIIGLAPELAEFEDGKRH